MVRSSSRDPIKTIINSLLILVLSYVPIKSANATSILSYVSSVQVRSTNTITTVDFVASYFFNSPLFYLLCTHIITFILPSFSSSKNIMDPKALSLCYVVNLVASIGMKSSRIRLAFDGYPCNI